MGSICSVSVHWGLITLVRAMLKHSSIARTRVLSCDDNKNTTLTLLTYFFYPGIIFLVKVVYKTVAWLILLHEPHQSKEKNFLIIKTFWCCWIKSEEPNFATLMKAVKWWLLKGGCQLSDERNFTSICHSLLYWLRYRPALHPGLGLHVVNLQSQVLFLVHDVQWLLWLSRLSAGR